MQIDSYRRPPLCRLCECPVVDGGVLVVKQRLHKLSRWWKAHWDTECEKKSCTVCHFCAWDLKFADENSSEKEPKEQRWWPKRQRFCNYKSYKDELLKPCSVKIEPLSLTDLVFPARHETYKCIYCKEKFPAKLQMSKHVRIAHKDIFLRCEYSYQCVNFFQNNQEQQEHHKNIHKSGATVMCPHCSKNIKKLSFLQHLQWSHPHNEVIRCSYYQCSTYFKNQEEKAVHIDEVHKSSFDCVYCDKFFSSTMSRHDHVRRWHKDVAIKCAFNLSCANYFKTQEDREQHVREVHQRAEKIRKAVQCLYCERIFVSLKSLREHIRLNHAQVSVKCPFPKCGTFFKNREDLEAHFESLPRHASADLTKKSAEKTLECSFCKIKMKVKNNLATHIERVHLKLREICPHCQKPYTNKTNHIVSDFCKLCQKKFKCLASLQAHTRKCKLVVHCPVCNKFFKCPTAMNYHCKIKHTVSVSVWKGLEFESRGFKCDECFVYFRCKTMLNRHNAYRHAATRFVCDFCEKGYNTKTSLASHVQGVHLNYHVIKCSMCGVYLKGKRNLRNHVKTHYNQNYVKCIICDKSLKASSLENHIKCVH